MLTQVSNSTRLTVRALPAKDRDNNASLAALVSLTTNTLLLKALI